MQIIGWFFLVLGVCGLATGLQARYLWNLPEGLNTPNLIILTVSFGIAVIGVETIRHARKK